MLMPERKQAAIKQAAAIAVKKQDGKHVASKTTKTKVNKIMAKAGAKQKMVATKVALGKPNHQANAKVTLKVVAKGNGKANSKMAVNNKKMISTGSKRQVQVALLKETPKHFINWRDHAKTAVVGKKLALLK